VAKPALGRVGAGAASMPLLRAWAASNGIEVSSRGRISSTVIAQYRAAGN